MKVYTAGQITGLKPDEYAENFRRAGKLLGIYGFEVVNPLEIDACEDRACGGRMLETPTPEGDYLHAWECYMKYDIAQLVMCDGIALLPNWINSKGAKFEFDVAYQCGLSIFVISENYRGMRQLRGNRI